MTHVRVGIGVLLKPAGDAHSVICGIRKSSHGAGKLALPGGHLEMYEEWSNCAEREVLEECGVECTPGSITWSKILTNDPMVHENKHYVTIFMQAQVAVNQTLQNMEPDKCEGWKAYKYEELVEQNARDNLFGPLKHLLELDSAQALFS